MSKVAPKITRPAAGLLPFSSHIPSPQEEPNPRRASPTHPPLHITHLPDHTWVPRAGILQLPPSSHSSKRGRCLHSLSARTYESPSSEFTSPQPICPPPRPLWPPRAGPAPEASRRHGSPASSHAYTLSCISFHPAGPPASSPGSLPRPYPGTGALPPRPPLLSLPQKEAPPPSPAAAAAAVPGAERCWRRRPPTLGPR